LQVWDTRAGYALCAMPVTALIWSYRINDIPRITRALQQAVREALWQHKIAGDPIVVWQNGRVEWIPAEEIPVDGPELEDEEPNLKKGSDPFF